jgi:hypothetical protein
MYTRFDNTNVQSHLVPHFPYIGMLRIGLLLYNELIYVQYIVPGVIQILL